MILSNTLFRTLTLVGIAVFTFVFGVSTIASGLSAQAKVDSSSRSQTFTREKSINTSSKNPRLAIGAMQPLRGGGSMTSLHNQNISRGASVDNQSDQSANSSGESVSKQQETPKQLHKKAQRRAKSTHGDTPVMTARDKREILWLARIIYSETKRPQEQRLIAWVVRNRVDTGYTGRTYESVANHSRQFSGLEPSDNRYEHNMSRWWASRGDSWKSALRIAKSVYFAPDSERPFSKTTRHFYSPISVYDKPAWAYGREAVHVVHSQQHEAPRFAFYSRVR